MRTETPASATDPRQQWQLAEQLFAGQRWPEAIAAFEQLTRALPQQPMPWLRLSTIATRQGRYRRALECLQAAQRTPIRNPELRQLIAALLHRAGEPREALTCLEKADFEACRDGDLLLAAASLSSQLEDLRRTHDLLDRVERLAPPTLASRYLRATTCLFEGDLDRAESGLEDALAIAPDAAQAHWALSRVRRQTSARNHVPRLRGAMANARNDAEIAHLGFALAKELDDLGEYDEAWQVLAVGRAAKRRQLEYRPEEDTAAFASLLEVCGRGFLHGSTSAAAGPAPIFIVGLPRTGTTLLERMLGRSPQVAVGGELDDFTLQMRWCADRFSKSYLDAGLFREAAGMDFSLLGRRYLEHVAWRADDRPFLTDKMPLNFLNIGFIHRALPQARIVHLVRHPLDAAWSNLKELFAEVYPYSYDLDELAAYYEHYRRLMAHWHEVLPGRVLDVSYEALVSDPAATGRALFEHCGLPWQDDYVNTERTAGAVTTASSAQVRQAIHTRGVGHWQHYQDQLEPLRQRWSAGAWLGADQ